MARVKKDLYGDGTVLYEYYEGSHIILRVSGICIKVYKPYSCFYTYNKSEVYSGPKIEMSMNSTVCLNITDFALINDSIAKAIQILNNEGFNLIDVNNWKDEYNKVPLDSVKQYDTSFLKEKVKYINPPVNSVFMDKNRKVFMYLGYGYLFSNTSYGMGYENRSGSPEIYVQFYHDIDVNNDIKVNNGTIEILTKEYVRVDTAVGRKKGIEILKEFPTDIISYKKGNSKYVVFREKDKQFSWYTGNDLKSKAEKYL